MTICAKGRTKGGRRHVQLLGPRVLPELAAGLVRSRLGQSLDLLRSHMDLSIHQLAAKLGWTPGLLAALIAGKITPSKGQHADLAKLARDYRKEKEEEEDGIQHSADRE